MESKTERIMNRLCAGIAERALTHADMKTQDAFRGIFEIVRDTGCYGGSDQEAVSRLCKTIEDSTRQRIAEHREYQIINQIITMAEQRIDQKEIA